MNRLPRREYVPLDKHVDMPRVRILSSEALGHRQLVSYYCLWGLFHHLSHGDGGRKGAGKRPRQDGI